MADLTELDDDDRTTLALLAEAEQQYANFLAAADIARVPLGSADGEWADSAFVPAPLTFAFRTFG